MFGGVSPADDNAPVVAADIDLFAIHHAHEPGGRFGDDLAVGIAPVLDCGDALRVEPVLGEQARGGSRSEARLGLVLGMGIEILGLAHPQRRVEPLRQPAGVAEMVRVKVRNQHSHEPGIAD